MAMELKFPSITRVTKVRSFPSLAKLAKALADEGMLLADAGFHSLYSRELDGLPLFILAGGEENKNWEKAGEILQALAAKKMERGARMVALGGGAHCDLVAMVASLYRRGVPLVLVPTTLLAQLDASVGGKTAVDAVVDGKLVKNFAGTFYPAAEVWICPEVLASLPEAERRSGVGELLKMLWLFGKKPAVAATREWIESGKITKEFWTQVEFAVQAKGKIVQKDPYDLKRIRECLNYGHTVGHVLESQGQSQSQRQGRLTHGEAVAWGMWAETKFARSKFAEEIASTLDALGFVKPKFPSDALALLKADKKMARGKLAMTVAVASGKRKQTQVAPEVLAEFLGGIK